MNAPQETPQPKTLDDLSRQIAESAAAMEQQIREVADKTQEPEKADRKTAAAAGRLEVRRKDDRPFIISAAHDLIRESPDGKEIISTHDTKAAALDAGARHWLTHGGGAQQEIRDTADQLRTPGAKTLK